MTTTNASTTTTRHDGSFWTSARDAIAQRRQARAEQQRIERELASYTTPADVQELFALLERSEEQSDSMYYQMIERACLRAA